MIRIDRQRIASPLDPKLVSRSRSRIDEWFALEVEIRRRRKPEFPERAEIARQAHPAVADLSYGKCAYCESRIDSSSGDVDWFRPFIEATDLSGEGSVDHYIWLFPEWENLFLACMSCSRSKRSLFPVEGRRAEPMSSLFEVRQAERALLLDPCYDDPGKHLRFLETGEIQPVSSKGETTIRVLNLNRDPLIEARRDAWQQTLDEAMSLIRSNRDLSGLSVREKPYAAFRFAALEALASEFRSLASQQSGPLTPAVIKERRTAEEILSTDPEAFRLTARPLRRVQIRNFRVLRELDLDFNEPSSERAPWLMLLGENATGKTTALEAIALALAGSEESQRHVRPAGLLSSGASEGSIVVWFWDQEAPAELRFSRQSDRLEGTKGPSAIVLGYGALRYVERRTSRRRNLSPFSQIYPLIGPISRIRYPGPWLLGLDDELFDTAARALQSILPVGRDATMYRNGNQLSFELNDHSASLGRLSAGYQTIVGMCADIMRLLFARWKTLSSATAIVLIDEIDAHLHPRWTMRIVRSLREAFPQVQFVTSSHDPLALRGLRNGEVALLRRDEAGTVLADQNLPPLEGLQVDQLLTSRVFGLDSTIDPETEGLLTEFYHLRSLPFDPARDSRIAEIRARVADREALGRSETERLMLQAADQFIRDTADSPDVRIALRSETLGRLRAIAAQSAAARRSRSQ